MALAPDGSSARLSNSAGDESEFGFGDEGVDDVGDGVAFVVGELVEVGEAGVDVVAGRVEGASFGGVVEQVVDGDVEDLGDADDGFEAGGDFVVFVAG